MRKLIDDQTGALALASSQDFAHAGGYVTLHVVGTMASAKVYYSPTKDNDDQTNVDNHVLMLEFTGPGVHTAWIAKGVLRADVDATASGVTVTAIT